MELTKLEGTARAVTESLKSEISSVALFRRGAVVTREAFLDRDNWSENVIIGDLPLSLEESSIRARIEPVNGAEAALPQPTDIRVELDVPRLGKSFEPPSAQAIREASKKIEKLHHQLEIIDKTWRQFGRITFNLPKAQDDQPPRMISIGAWDSTTEWVQKGLEDLTVKRSKLKKDLYQAEEDLRKIRREIKEAKAVRIDEKRVTKQVIVSLRGEKPEAARLVLEYRISAAMWRPSYVFRIDRDGKSARLGIRALVAQNSGEPWQRVKLSVSTADMRQTIKLPELKSLRIGRSQQQDLVRAWREPPQGAETLFEGLDQAVAAHEEQEYREAKGLSPTDTIEAIRKEVSKVIDAEETIVAIPEESKRKRKIGTRGPAGGSFHEGEQPDLFMPTPAAAQGVPPGALPPEPMAASEEVMMQAQDIPVAAMAPEMPLRKRASPLGAIAGLADRALSGLGGSPPPSPGAPPAQSGSMRLEESAADDFGYQSESDLFADDGLVEQQTQLSVKKVLFEYGRLELTSWDAKHHERGRLKPRTVPVGLEDLPPELFNRVARILASAQSATTQITSFPATTSDVSRSSGAYDYRYEAAGLIDVPSDGKAHNIPLFSSRGEVSLSVVAVPRESDQAVRMADLRNPLKAPILAGPADIYLGDEFLVTSSLDTVPSGAELSIGLGVEEGIKIARNTHFKESTHGLLKGGLSLDHTVEIEVGSRLSQPINIEVRERLPIVDEDEKDIKIEVSDPDPPWKPYKQTTENPIKGGKRWNFRLDGGETKKLSYQYKVHIESKNELIGGNRRERGA